MQAIQTHSGQYQRYGDTYNIWHVTVDEDTDREHASEEIVKYMNEMHHLHLGEFVPTEQVWREKGDTDHRIFWSGFYTINRLDEDKYEVLVFEPYKD